MALSNRFRWTRNIGRNGRQSTLTGTSSDSASSAPSEQGSRPASRLPTRLDDAKRDMWSLDDLKRLLTELQDEDFNRAIQMRKLRQEE